MSHLSLIGRKRGEKWKETKKARGGRQTAKESGYLEKRVMGKRNRVRMGDAVIRKFPWIHFLHFLLLEGIGGGKKKIQGREKGLLDAGETKKKAVKRSSPL